MKNKEILKMDLKELLKKTREQETYFTLEEIAELLKSFLNPEEIEQLKKRKLL